ncbi:MAG: hypothetical protein HFE97_04250 [Oscillospiraceae bacterium]|nr:hypothetical protein [Oscillospiraceae bacterium]
MVELEIGGTQIQFDPAAVSALRYRAAYGRSALAALEDCRDLQCLERVLLRMAHCMIPPDHRPVLTEFARLARRDPEFIPKALSLRDALYGLDHRFRPHTGGGAGELDEYDLIAGLLAAQLDTAMLYELPLMHLTGILARASDQNNPDIPAYRPMTATELADLYPKRS